MHYLSVLLITCLFDLSLAYVRNSGVSITFYGWPDSEPNTDCTTGANTYGERNGIYQYAPYGSNTIAYPGCPWNGGTRGQYAGGDGSWTNPLSAAAYFGSNGEVGSFEKCEVIFSPFLGKFLIIEDLCPSCAANRHVDVWLGPSGDQSQQTWNDVCDCENYMTPGNAVDNTCFFSQFGSNEGTGLNKNWVNTEDTSVRGARTGALYNTDSSTCAWADSSLVDWNWSSNSANLNQECSGTGTA